MYKEIHQSLSSKQKLLLSYRGLPTFFAFLSLFLAFISCFNLFYNHYTSSESVPELLNDDNATINNNTINVAEQIHLNQIEQRKKTKPTPPPFFSLLFFIIPLYLIRKDYIKGKEIEHIISNGMITTSELTHTEEVEGRNLILYKLRFEYYADPKKMNQHQLIKFTRFIQRFTDESKELVIFHKDKPESAILIDDLPESISIFIKQNWI